MSQDEPIPNTDPKKPGNKPAEEGNKEQKSNPGKPGNDPDQTPERETNKPPVAKPDKGEQSKKIGFHSNQFLLF